MSIDDLLRKYMGIYSTMMGHMDTIESGTIPFSDVPGAPKTLDEAREGIAGIAFATQQIINDLLEWKMNLTYEEAEQAEESNLTDAS